MISDFSEARPCQKTDTVNLQRESINEARVLLMLLLRWKGEDVESLLPLTQSILNYDNKYSQKNDAIKISSILLMLLDGFPRDATTEIDNFFDAEYIKRNNSPEKMINDFSKYVWHKIRRDVRIRSQADLSEEQHIMCMAQIKALGLDEEAFWPFSSPKDVFEEVHTSKKNDGAAKKQETKVNRYLTNSEKIVALMMERLKQCPDTCINCFQKHQLKDCPNLSTDATKNLAAWISPDYEKITKHTRPRSMKNTARQVALGPGKKMNRQT